MFKLFLSHLKILTRDKELLFWSMMFPLMFTFIFGFFFGKGSTTTGTVVLVDKAQTTMSQSFEKAMEESELFKIQKEDNVDNAKALLKKGKVGAVVLIPEKFGERVADAPNNITVIDDPANAQMNAVVLNFTSSFLTNANFQIKNITPTFSVVEEKTSANQVGYFDFVLVGLIGMALMNSSIQGIAITMSKYREDKILKRIVTTPLKSWRFIISNILARLVINAVQVSLILLVGVYFFKAHIYGSIILIYAISLVGAILFQLIGFTIAGLVKTTAAAEGMATAIAIPMLFLSGVFFPIDQLPKWLYLIVQYLPLAPLLRVLRGVGLESSSPFENPTNIIILVSWILVCLVFASYKFRLSEE